LKGVEIVILLLKKRRNSDIKNRGYVNLIN